MKSTQQQSPLGVLLMAYGTPETPDEVEPYFTHIRGGRTPAPEAVARLTQRYARVGGRTPLLGITRDVARALERELSTERPTRVHVGMKHWHPFIADTIRQMAADGIDEMVAVAMAPHYSRISIGAYRSAVAKAVEATGRRMAVTFVDRWHMQPELITMSAGLVTEALARFPDADRRSTFVVFSAHSLPERIREWNDPYEAELLETSAAVARATGVERWAFAWQSAGETGEPWIGPDICDYLDTLHAQGERSVLQVPIGFVSDHLEIMWDIDVEAKERAAALGITFRRTELPNARPAFIQTVAAVVRGALKSAPQFALAVDGR